MPHDVQVKTHLVMGGTFPAAFYGVELVPLGEQHIRTMRPSVANGILGHNHSRNSEIAIACLPRLDDPLVFILLKVFRTIRRFVSTLSPMQQLDFFTMISNHSGERKDCHGPAGCVAYYLNLINWDIDEHGQLGLPNGISLQLRTTSLKTFRFWLDATRQKDLLAQCTKRTVLHGLVINTIETKMVLSMFQPKEQFQLLNELSGAFQTSEQKGKWADDQSDQCAFCDASDSRFHRLYECPATAHVRIDFQDVLDHYAKQESVIHELPVLYEHDDFNVLNLIAYQHVEAQFSQALLDKIAELAAMGHRTHFYTDGSLMFPHIRTVRYAAYSIVIDTCQTDPEREEMVLNLGTTHLMPATLQTLAVARVQGNQTIYRAELTAVVRV